MVENVKVVIPEVEVVVVISIMALWAQRDGEEGGNDDG